MNTLRETTGAAPIRSRTSCAKPVQTYIKHIPKMSGSIPKSTKIVTRRIPKSMKIGVWMGLCPLFVVSGALGREFSGKLGGRCAKLGPRWQQVAPKWATMASRWPSWSQLWRLWGHLGRNLEAWRGLGQDFGGVLAHGWESKNLDFPFGFSTFLTIRASWRGLNLHGPDQSHGALIINAYWEIVDKYV